MAHELSMREDGTAEMAYVGKTPWHGLGQALNPGAPIEAWARAAGMTWRVHGLPISYSTWRAGALHQHTIPRRQALVRSDTERCLGIVSNQYKPVQPADVLDFFKRLIDLGGYQLHTAGVLKSGQRLWALAEMDHTARIVSDDVIEGYILLTTSYDGQNATTARVTTVRVVCHNTLTAATQGGANIVTVPHTLHFNPEQVRQQLGIARDLLETFALSARRLATASMVPSDLNRFLETLFNSPALVLDPDAEPLEAHGPRTVRDLFYGRGKGSELAGMTAWGALNAVTEYVDFHRRARGQGNRLHAAWFGEGEQLKNRAFKQLTALVGA